MNVNVEQLEDRIVVTVEGRIDTLTAPQLEDDLEGLVTADRSMIVMHLHQVSYISSAGIRVFVLLAKQVQKVDGHIVLVGLTDLLKRIFKISGLMRFFEFQDD